MAKTACQAASCTGPHIRIRHLSIRPQHVQRSIISQALSCVSGLHLAQVRLVWLGRAVAECSCLCSHTLEPQPHSPYCVVWLKNNTAAQSSSSVGSHTSPESGPLGLLASSGAVTAAAVGTNFANAGLAAAKTARPPSQGAQTQCSGVVEDCNEPLWNSVLQYHVASSDAVLRLQVSGCTECRISRQCLVLARYLHMRLQVAAVLGLLAATWHYVYAVLRDTVSVHPSPVRRCAAAPVQAPPLNGSGPAWQPLAYLHREQAHLASWPA